MEYGRGMDDAEAAEVGTAVFDDIAVEHLTRPGVDIGPMFGTEGLRIRGKVYAFVVRRGSLVVKLPKERIDELVSQTTVTRMVMRERELREWAEVPASAADSWPELMDEALAFVDAITP